MSPMASAETSHKQNCQNDPVFSQGFVCIGLICRWQQSYNDTASMDLHSTIWTFVSADAILQFQRMKISLWVIEKQYVQLLGVHLSADRPLKICMTETYSGKIRHKQPCYFELGIWGFLYVGLFSGQVDLTRPKKKNFQNISSFALWSLANFHCDTICLFQKQASVALALWSANKSLNSGQFPPFQSKRCWCCRQPLGHLHSTLSWCLFWWYSNLNSSVFPLFCYKGLHSDSWKVWSFASHFIAHCRYFF